MLYGGDRAVRVQEFSSFFKKRLDFMPTLRLDDDTNQPAREVSAVMKVLTTKNPGVSVLQAITLAAALFASNLAVEATPLAPGGSIFPVTPVPAPAGTL